MWRACRHRRSCKRNGPHCWRRLSRRNSFCRASPFPEGKNHKAAVVVRGSSNFPYLSSKEWPRLSFTARIGRYRCSFQACSLRLSGNGARAGPTAAIERGPPNSLHLSLEGRPGCPRLRASNEHIPIVRVLRARRAPGCSASHPAMMLSPCALVLNPARPI